MGYIINFVGLVNFFGDTSHEKLLLLPNNPNPPDPHIPPHYANVFVGESQVADASGWPDTPDTEANKRKVLRFPITTSSQIQITGQTLGGGSLTLSAEDALVQPLKGMIDIDPNKANTIAKIQINNGDLSSFVLATQSIVKQLRVKGNDLVTITATPDDPKQPKKTLILRNGVEIVIANTSQIGGPHPTGEKSHFFLYAQLDKNKDESQLKEATASNAFDEIASGHPYLQLLRDHAGEVPLPGCSVTNCCFCHDK